MKNSETWDVLHPSAISWIFWGWECPRGAFTLWEQARSWAESVEGRSLLLRCHRWLIWKNYFLWSSTVAVVQIVSSSKLMCVVAGWKVTGLVLWQVSWHRSLPKCWLLGGAEQTLPVLLCSQALQGCGFLLIMLHVACTSTTLVAGWRQWKSSNPCTFRVWLSLSTAPGSSWEKVALENKAVGSCLFRHKAKWKWKT